MQKGHYYKKQIMVCRECKSDEFTRGGLTVSESRISDFRIIRFSRSIYSTIKFGYKLNGRRFTITL